MLSQKLEGAPLLDEAPHHTERSTSASIRACRQQLPDTPTLPLDTRPESASPNLTSMPHSGDAPGLTQTTMIPCPTLNHLELFYLPDSRPNRSISRHQLETGFRTSSLISLYVGPPIFLGLSYVELPDPLSDICGGKRVRPPYGLLPVIDPRRFLPPTHRSCASFFNNSEAISQPSPLRREGCWGFPIHTT